MGYISKLLLQKAYTTLGDLTSDHKQGQTQITSALRYVFALDLYKKEYNSDCDLSKPENRTIFTDYVKSIVCIEGAFYTTNFYNTIKEMEDCGVGSNFFSAGVVNNSKQNKQQLYDYPARGQNPLFNVINNKLVWNESYIANINNYLINENFRSAFIVWLIRNENIDALNYSSIKDVLSLHYTQITVNTLLPEENSFNEFINGYSLEEIKPTIKVKDLFPVEIEEGSHQQIYYGAPGTGKSHSINEQTEGKSVIRTTFHPDSDYSTFVGAYKPTMGLLPICDELGQPMKIGSTVLHKEQIIYEFVDQAFLQAYVKAWRFYADNEDTPQNQYLIIEEINRGNCAQIFGDLFQLLDRNSKGFSDYPINADKDMKKHLAKAFKKDGKTITINNPNAINALYKGRDVVREVLEGDILLLPSNLYIWATMNTSDQSLFPIDSAFKRRWDWQYMPIAQGRDEAGRELAWTIDVNGNKYSWWSFLEKINAQIGEATQSEDKKLGFFFCKAKDGVITPETFVGKVVFYLWNDVFKDYGFEGSIFKDKDGTELSFNKFYAADLKGNAVVQKDKVELFLNNLGVELASGEDETDGNDKVGMTITYNGEAIREKNDLETYVKAIEKIGVERIAPLNITCYGQQVVGTEPPANYAWRTVNDYKILTFKLHRHMERILSEIATGLQEDIKVTFE